MTLLKFNHRGTKPWVTVSESVLTQNTRHSRHLRFCTSLTHMIKFIVGVYVYGLSMQHTQRNHPYKKIPKESRRICEKKAERLTKNADMDFEVYLKIKNGNFAKKAVNNRTIRNAYSKLETKYKEQGKPIKKIKNWRGKISRMKKKFGLRTRVIF